MFQQKMFHPLESFGVPERFPNNQLTISGQSTDELSEQHCSVLASPAGILLPGPLVIILSISLRAGGV